MKKTANIFYIIGFIVNVAFAIYLGYIVWSFFHPTNNVTTSSGETGIAMGALFILGLMCISFHFYTFFVISTISLIFCLIKEKSIAPHIFLLVSGILTFQMFYVIASIIMIDFLKNEEDCEDQD